MKIAAFGLAMIQAVDLDYFENTGTQFEILAF